jgi:hypothetical protein
VAQADASRTSSVTQPNIMGTGEAAAGHVGNDIAGMQRVGRRALAAESRAHSKLPRVTATRTSADRHSRSRDRPSPTQKSARIGFRRGTGRNRTDDSSFADCRLTTWPRRPMCLVPVRSATRRRGDETKRVASCSTPLARSTRTTFGQLLQTGMLFIITQQLHPFFIITVMQSQHDWIMAIMAESPLV